MTDTPSPASPDSPYGPADGVEELFGVAPHSRTDVVVEPVAAAAAVGDTPTVVRARRTLQRLALWLPLAGLVLSIAAIVVQVATGGAFGLDPVSEISGLTLTFIGPALIVLGLHMIVWRAMVRPLTRMAPGNRVGAIIGIGGVLSLLSVILVFILVFVGFMLLSLLLSASDQAL